MVAAAIEQNHDDHGIIWPDTIAPFQVALVPIGYGKSEKVRETMDKLYSELVHAGFDVLLDDRDERPGVIFADMDLIGVPHRVVIGDKGRLIRKVRRQAEAELMEMYGRPIRLNLWVKVEQNWTRNFWLLKKFGYVP